MAREGLGIVVGAFLFTIVMLVGAALTPLVHIRIMAICSVLVTALVVNFFRDPERTIPIDKRNIVSPADGKVIEIQTEDEKEFLQQPATRVSIFLNVFDVHVNRVPIDGKVRYFRYQKGSFIKAYKSDASTVNEQTVIGVEDGEHKVIFKQIAGLIARRIVCNIREGSNVKQGERMGMIKFGSRVDIFLPESAEIKVALNQKVKGGESIIGVFTNEI